MADSYINKECNSDLMKVIFSFLLGNDVQLNQMDAEDPDIADYVFVPSFTSLVEKPKVCLQRPSVVSDYKIIEIYLLNLHGPLTKTYMKPTLNFSKIRRFVYFFFFC